MMEATNQLSETKLITLVISKASEPCLLLLPPLRAAGTVLPVWRRCAGLCERIPLAPVLADRYSSLDILRVLDVFLGCEQWLFYNFCVGLSDLFCIDARHLCQRSHANICCEHFNHQVASSTIAPDLQHSVRGAEREDGRSIWTPLATRKAWMPCCASQQHLGSQLPPVGHVGQAKIYK